MEAIIVKYDEGQLGFIRYTILVTVGDQSWSVIRRFNDFQPLHEAIARAFSAKAFRAQLPPKKWFGRFNPEFLRERKSQLQDYLDAATGLPGLLDSCPYARRFFEVDWHLGGGEAGHGRGGTQDGVAVDDREALEQGRVAAILEETSRAFINTSLPLHQVSVEMDPAEVAQQRAKLLQCTSGFRGTAPAVQQLAGGNAIPTAVGGGSGAGGGGSVGVVDVLTRPACMTLGIQGQTLEKQGLRVADELREARQIRTRDDKDLVCHLREERVL